MSTVRNINKLPATVPRETIACLKGFMGLRTNEEIQEWHKFCRTSPDKSVRDWHQQKVNNPWILPSLNEFLSKMYRTSWKLMPNHSNLVEGGHSGTNDVMSIGKEIGEAVTSTRELDNQVADELEAMERNGVLPKCWNGSAEWEHLNTQCQAWTHAKKKSCDDKLAHYDEFTAELQMLSTQQTESLNLDKSLRSQIKALRDNHDINWKERIKALQQQVEDEKEKWRGFKNRWQVINTAIQELKDKGLSGSRINGRRPTLLAVKNEACDAPEDSDNPDLLVESVLPPLVQVNLDEDPPNIKGTPLIEVEDKDNRNLSAECVLPVPAMLVGLDKHRSLVKSFLELLNSNDDDYDNHTVGQFPDTLNATQGVNSMNSGEIFGANFDFNFNDFNFSNMDNLSFENIDNFDLGNVENFDFGDMNIDTTKFNTLGVDTTFAEHEQAFIFPLRLPHSDADMMSLIDPSTAHSPSGSTSTTSMLNVPTLPKSDIVHTHWQPTKRKKIDEVDATHILPKGLQQSRTKSAKAAAALEAVEEP